MFSNKTHALCHFILQTDLYSVDILFVVWNSPTKHGIVCHIIFLVREWFLYSHSTGVIPESLSLGPSYLFHSFSPSIYPVSTYGLHIAPPLSHHFTSFEKIGSVSHLISIEASAATPSILLCKTPLFECVWTYV